MEQPPSQLLISLGLILLGSRVAGQISARFGLPSVLGMLVVGILLGPTAFGLVEMSPILDGMSHVGVVLLLFVAGLETDLVEMRRVGLAATLAAVGGVAFPMATGTWLSWWFGYGVAESVFVGTILTATSVTVSAHVLKELGQLRGAIGSAILGAAVIDDVIGVVVLTVVVSTEGGGSLFDLVRLAGFIPLALLGGYALVNLMTDRLNRAEREHRYVEVMALVLAFGWAAEEIGGLAAISGAYLAGVLFGRTLLRDELADFGNLIGYAFFAPVFLVTTGMMADLATLTQAPLFVALLAAIAISTKAIGSGLGSRLAGFSTRESMAVGAGMVARGEVALVIAVIGHQSGIVGDETFTASIGVTLLTTLAAPLLLRLALPPNAMEPNSDHRVKVAQQIERLA